MKITSLIGVLTVTLFILTAQIENPQSASQKLETNAADPVTGLKVFSTTCFACHGLNGKGAIPGVPDFTKSPDRLAQPDSVLVQHVVNGFQSPGSLMPMPPKGGNPNLTDQNILDAIAYIRSEFGKVEEEKK